MHSWGVLEVLDGICLPSSTWAAACLVFVGDRERTGESYKGLLSLLPAINIFTKKRILLKREESKHSRHLHRAGVVSAHIFRGCTEEHGSGDQGLPTASRSGISKDIPGVCLNQLEYNLEYSPLVFNLPNTTQNQP